MAIRKVIFPNLAHRKFAIFLTCHISLPPLILIFLHSARAFLPIDFIFFKYLALTLVLLWANNYFGHIKNLPRYFLCFGQCLLHHPNPCIGAFTCPHVFLVILLTRPDICYIFGNIFCTTSIVLLATSHALLFYCKALCCWSRDQKVWRSFQLGQTNVYYFIGYHNSARYFVFKLLLGPQIHCCRSPSPQKFPYY